MNKNLLFILSCILLDHFVKSHLWHQRFISSWFSKIKFKDTMVGDILPLNTKEVIPCDSVASILARQYYARKAKLTAKTCSLSSITVFPQTAGWGWRMKIIKLIVVFVTVVMMMVTNHAVNDEDDDGGVWINYNILATAPSKHCGISIVALSDQYCRFQRSTKFQGKNIFSSSFFFSVCLFFSLFSFFWGGDYFFESLSNIFKCFSDVVAKFPC